MKKSLITAIAARMQSDVVAAIAEHIDASSVAEQVTERLGDALVSRVAEEFDGISSRDIAEHIDASDIAERIANEIDLDDLASELAENVELRDVAEELEDSVDVAAIAEQIHDDVMDKIADQLNSATVARRVLIKLGDTDALVDAIAEEIIGE